MSEPTIIASRSSALSIVDGVALDGNVRLDETYPNRPPR